MKQDLNTFLVVRQAQTEALLEDPRLLQIYIERAETYLKLGFPDLAAADAYKALTLIEEALDQEDLISNGDDNGDSSPNNGPSPDARNIPKTPALNVSRCSILMKLSSALFEIGCLRDSFRFFKQARELGLTDTNLDVLKLVHAFEGTDAGQLSNSGFVRREIYPWNNHEPDRSSPKEIANLNERMHHVAPQLEVRSTTLPALHILDDSLSDTVSLDSTRPIIQLGLFAKSSLKPGRTILTELSPLTATTAHGSSLCDCCQAPLPSITSYDPPVSCTSCNDVVFCSFRCEKLAQSSYHPSVCGNEDGLDQIGRAGSIQERSDNLYLLLVARSIAMAETQSIHPLDLPEIKYLWGDFNQAGSLPCLPFTFHHNIVLPFRILEAMQSTTDGSTDPFTTSALLRYDAWVINSLYAKFRGVASARQSTWDGAPEVSAVHPLWCLANHSCAPNVTWNWEGQIDFKVRNEEERVRWRIESAQSHFPGIKEGEEILNHYCDVRLPIKERREWAKGALGGACRCERCLWESS